MSYREVELLFIRTLEQVTYLCFMTHSCAFSNNNIIVRNRPIGFETEGIVYDLEYTYTVVNDSFVNISSSKQRLDSDTTNNFLCD
jgi:hypothetical protein